VEATTLPAPTDSWLRFGQTESETPRRIRVILSRGIEITRQASELPFDIHHCEGTTIFPELCEEVGPNVLLVDLGLLPTEETAQLRARVERLHNAFTIALSDETDHLHCERIIRMGFAGLLRRDEARTTLVRAVLAVVNGQLWFPREILSRVLRMLLGEQSKSRLTSREMQILDLIGSGLNNQQIADTLFISRETVRWHVRGLYSKLGIKDRRSAGEYWRSIQRVGNVKPVRSEIPNDPRHSGTAG
jgi:DNA-binding NarL/FixJ family response regulator